jgi:hypothetical protein
MIPLLIILFGIGSARNQMYVLYIREDLKPKYLKRLVGEMAITISRNVVQLGDWLAQGKFAIALGGVDCPDLALKGLPVAVWKSTRKRSTTSSLGWRRWCRKNSSCLE